ncbi:plastid division protein PDV1 isoform X2 [Momordica charantia]|uniref:Plastid division protein PDV1 isoform X2 n=1 Tax=Momordica charantia TaxID=3673 RepID=A0A6J1CG84_MOMCH|nr:plastid division protein PDV1 isoform X2 [Momordica charantia]
MKWDMEIEEIEAVLEKIWDIHDKLSEAIHSISRDHFLTSTKNLRKSQNKDSKTPNGGADDNPSAAFPFLKEFRIDIDDSAIQEARSLNAIRTALENLEDQLEFLHTVQVQQQVERDAAIARLEQSRIVLAMRLAEHHGKNYKVINEALAFVGDVRYEANFVSHENQYGPPFSPNGQKLMPNSSKRSNTLIKMLFSTFNFAKKSLKMDNVGGILSNAAMVAISMLAFLHLHQVAFKQSSQERDDNPFNRNLRRTSQLEGSSPNEDIGNFDVLSARG